jgi:hypothetical protein
LFEFKSGLTKIFVSLRKSKTVKLRSKFYFLILVFTVRVSLLKASEVLTDTIPQVWIDSTGRMGIGTNAPQDKLHLQGDFRLNGKLILNGIPGDSGAVLISRGAGNTPFWDSTFRKGLWEDLDDKIRYANKNVEVQKTLIQYGNTDGLEGTGLNIYNRWKPNIPGGSDVPSFNMTGGRFYNGPGQPDNYVWNLGPNMASGGGPDQVGRSGFGLSFEYRFFIDNIPYNEFHVLHIDSVNNLQRRPVYCIFAHDASRLSWNHHLTDWSIFDKDNTKVVFTIDTQNEKQTYNYNNQNKFRHIFSNTNYQPIWQKDSAGEISPLIGYLGNYVQIGNDAGNTLMKIGQNLELGNFSGFDYIGPTVGSIEKNFLIGNPAQKYVTIWHHTNSDLNTRFVTVLNNQGWGIGLNQTGAMYLHDFTSETKPFYLSGSAPDYSLHVSSSGNVALGSTDDSEKLVVSGNMKLTGGILLNSQAGIPGQTIVSNGPGQANAWEFRLKSRHEESFTATEGQTTFIIESMIEALDGTKLPIEVFRNGVKLKFVSESPTGRQFSYLNDEITTSACEQGDEIEIIYFKK